MNIRKFELSDYNELTEWWSFWRFPAPSLNLLPILPDDRVNGFLATKDGMNIACGFLYFTNSDFCWIEYIVSNPKATKEDRANGLNKVIEALTEEGKAYGFTVAFTSVKNESLIKRMKGLGFIEGTTGATELIKIL